MFARCANSDCGKQFDYREGQLIRLCRSTVKGPPTADQHVVEHFWLCGSCSELYVLAHESENIIIKPRVEEVTEGRTRDCVAVA